MPIYLSKKRNSKYGSNILFLLWILLNIYLFFENSNTNVFHYHFLTQPKVEFVILGNIFIRQIKDENGIVIKEVYDWYVIAGSIAFTILVIGIAIYLSSTPPDGSNDGSLVSNTGDSSIKYRVILLPQKRCLDNGI